MKIWKIAVGGLTILGVTAGVYLGGYYTHKQEIAPFHRLITRVENQFHPEASPATLTERLTASLETTFLRLKGTVHEIPDNDFINGGAMTVWGDRLLVMDHAGRVYLLDEPGGLRRLESIAPPENGKAAYVALSETPALQGIPHRPDKMRYNDIAFLDTPGFRGLVMSYTWFDADRACFGTRISRLPVDPDQSDPASLTAAPGDWDRLYDTEPCLDVSFGMDAIRAGGRMLFEAPGTLYLGSGDYGRDGIAGPDAGMRSDENAYGKVMAIDLLTGASRVVSRGHRNITGLAFDREGRLWTAEHAERGGDELNQITPGTDYGWPAESFGTLYSGQPLPTTLDSYGRHDLFPAPAFAWLPSAGISTLTALRGIDPAWDGDFLAGSLSSEDFGQSLWRIRTEGARVVLAERIRLKRRIRHVLQFGDRIAVWLDSNELVLFTAERREDPLAATLATLRAELEPALAVEVEATLQACAQCHSFEQGVNMAGPSLNGVVGRAIASTSFEGHGEALLAMDGVWDAARLKAYLSDPAGFAPGTVMPDPELNGQDALIDGVIRALELTDNAAAPDLRYD